jgi:hypothetical protein
MIMEKPLHGANGEFFFKETILDQLDRYLYYSARLRKADKKMYDMYMKLGAHILPNGVEFDRYLSPWFKTTLPGFGAVVYGCTPEDEEHEKKTEKMLPRFMYFCKVKKPDHTIEVVNQGTVYAVTVYWDKLREKSEKDFKKGSCQEFPVVVNPDGSVRILNVLLDNAQVIRHKIGPDKGKRTTLHRQYWGIHPEFISWAKQHDTPVQEHLSGLFATLASGFERGNSSMIRVEASRNKQTAVFGVNILRTPYFFRDRDSVVEDGVKKRIFHIVKSHERRGKAIKTHFRGLREFKWNSYGIRITVPGRDHAALADFNLGSVDAEEFYDKKNLINGGVMANMLKNHIHNGYNQVRL